MTATNMLGCVVTTGALVVVGFRLDIPYEGGGLNFFVLEQMRDLGFLFFRVFVCLSLFFFVFRDRVLLCVSG